MRANDSHTMHLEGAQIPGENLLGLGAQGDELWYVFEVIAPHRLMAMAGACVRLAITYLPPAAAAAGLVSTTTSAVAFTVVSGS